MLNKVFLHARLTKIPELRKTQSGKSVCTFVAAVKRDSSSDVTDFIPCVAWEGRAEFISQHFTKGQEILITGSMNNRKYEDKNGVERTITEVLVASAEFCGPKHAAYEKDGGERRPQAEDKTFYDMPDDGDLPF